jgi:hypothetical protein
VIARNVMWNIEVTGGALSVTADDGLTIITG